MFIRTESPRSDGGRKLDIENMTIHEETSYRKDCSSRWTDENGKLSIQFDVFDTNLPTADEVCCRSCQSLALMTWTFSGSEHMLRNQVLGRAFRIAFILTRNSYFVRNLTRNTISQHIPLKTIQNRR